MRFSMAQPYGSNTYIQIPVHTTADSPLEFSFILAVKILLLYKCSLGQSELVM